MLVPYHSVEANRINLINQFIKVYLQIPEVFKRQRSHPTFKIALIQFYLSQHWYMRQRLNLFLNTSFFFCLHKNPLRIV